MSKRRKLTSDEKERIEVYVLEQEHAKHPTAVVEVHVDDELDDEGRFHVRTVAMTETMVPEGQEPWKRR